MIDKDYISINKELLPYSFEISLADEIFTLEVQYNATGDFFTIALYKDDELVCAGEKVVYGVPLWVDVEQPDKYPALVIIPQAENKEDVSAVTYANLDETVFLVIDNGGDDDAE